MAQALEKMHGAAAAMCDAALERGGAVQAMVLIEDTRTGAVIGIPYKDGSAPVEMQQFLIAELIRQMRAAGSFGSAVLVAEAWISRCAQGKEAMMGVMRPSQDPDRQEIVMVLAVDSTGGHEIRSWRLDRSSGKPRRGEPMGEFASGGGTKFASWFLEAFDD